MDDIIGEQRKKAFIPISASLLTLAIGVAVSWNALDGQVPDRLPMHVLAKQDDRSDTVGSIGDFLRNGGTVTSSVHPKFNADVELIQKTLKDQGLYASKVDGVSGPATETAIRAYARENGIAGKGDLRQAVLEHIQYNRQLRDAIKITTKPKASAVSQTTVGLIQTGLSELGYDPGPVDGKMGQKTEDAIRDFQRDRALIPTGEPSGELLIELRKVTGLTSLKGS
ncbi:MAG: peptidoglycan-binding domain-containing protein [Pseudomonadota bacterium]